MYLVFSLSILLFWCFQCFFCFFFFPNLQTYVLGVNIHCDGCKQKVKKIIQIIEGVSFLSHLFLVRILLSSLSFFCDLTFHNLYFLVFIVVYAFKRWFIFIIFVLVLHVLDLLFSFFFYCFSLDQCLCFVFINMLSVMFLEISGLKGLLIWVIRNSLADFLFEKLKKYF